MTKLAVGMLVVLLLGWLSPAAAEDNFAELLVGRWEGKVEFLAGTFDRILLIRSVEQKDGKWRLTAAYGPKGPGLSPVADGSVEKAGGDVLLRFRVTDGRDRRLYAMKLTLLKDGKHLIGTIYLGAGMVGMGDRPAKFEKAEAAD